jgi:hypothetical protein
MTMDGNDGKDDLNPQKWEKGRRDIERGQG